MVDPIATKAVTTSDRIVAPVSRIEPATPAPSVVQPTDATTDAARAAPQVTALAESLSAAPPIDADRVARIKKAIADGTFPIFPSKIADRLIALKYDWHPHDDAA